MTRNEILRMLEAEDASSLFAEAYRVKCAHLGQRVALRGLVEFSNICTKNCFYCGIRRARTDVVRYRMSADEIVEAASWAAAHRFGSVVFQSGECASEENTCLVENVLHRLRTRFGDALGITLSLGEQSEETLRRWKDAGAHRYLLRIETSNPALYASLHPKDHSWTARCDCLRTLKRLGYIVGTGVMIGLPGQTVEDLANDLLFFRDEDIDMIGMGPFLEHPATPLYNSSLSAEDRKAAVRARLDRALRMIAAARLLLPTVNIAATTALEAIDPEGREKGLLAGANVIMPNVTPQKYRESYLLYPNKPCTQEDSAHSVECLVRRLASIGEEIAWGERVDPLHYTEAHA